MSPDSALKRLHGQENGREAIREAPTLNTWARFARSCVLCVWELRLAISTTRLGYLRLPSKLGSRRTHVSDNVFIVAGPVPSAAGI